MLRVTPHPALAAHVAARRGVNDFAPALKPPNASKVWAAFKSNVVDHPSFTTKRAMHDPLTKEPIAVIARGALPDQFDARLLGVIESLFNRGRDPRDPNATLAQIATEKHGVAAMIEMKLVAGGILVKQHEGEIVFDSDDIQRIDGSFSIARAIVCRADDASYAKARDFAAEWRKTRSVVQRVRADYLFPSEPAWANEDIDALLAEFSKGVDKHWYLGLDALASTNDDARVIAYVNAINEYAVWNLIGELSCDFATGLPPDGALRVFSTLLEKGKKAGKTQLAALGLALTALEGEEAAAILAGLLLHAPIGPMAVDYFRRFPALARSVLPAVASGSSKAAEAARSILAASAPREDLPAADASEIPAPLRDTPWRKKKKAKPLIIADAPTPKAMIEWSDGEREGARSLPHNYGWITRALTDMTSEVLAEWRAQPAKNRYIDLWTRWTGTTHASYRVPDDALLAEWNSNATSHTYFPLRVLAIHGEAALPGLFMRDPFKQWSDDIFETQLHVVGAEGARLAAEAAVRRKAWRKRAQEWLAKHASVVAQSLLPAALGKEGKERNIAANAIRIAARANHDAVVAAAKALGADAERATHDLIDGDPLAMLDVKGKLPPFLRIEDLPPLATRSKKRVPLEASEALLEILRSTTPDAPYAGLDAIREGLDPHALGEFLWAVVQAWILAGAKTTFEWIPMSLALLGDDACARRLAPYVREWARKDAKKANLAVDVLAAIGTSTALLHLSHVADKSRFEAAKTYAKEALERTAAEQGLTIDELADRTVPDLELDATGKATLDFGARKFTVTFDEGLHPLIASEDGARLPAFPRGTKTDDAALVKLASARFKGIKADAESVAQSLLRRFEAAMIRGRTWRADAFRTYVLGHPLVGHVARRLVWRAEPSGAFRVAEDRSLADQNDAEYTLPDDATVMLPHPLDLGKDATIAWSRIFSDYGVVQPFEQLARATYAFEEGMMERFAGRKSKAGPLIGLLDARGWQKWADETSLSAAGKAVRLTRGGEANVSLYFSPGIELSEIAASPEQEFKAPTLQGATWDAVHAIDFSELVRDLETMTH